VLLEAFEAICSIRDVRQIKNKLTGRFKDFAFLEFFTPEETSLAYREANEPSFRIAGQKVTVLYSRNKSDDDYFKPLPYETGKRERKPRDRPAQEDNYYHIQRQREIEKEKARPSITMEQLKEKREQELRRNQPAPKEMSEEQWRRRKAEQLAKQWEREMKVQTTLFVCPACCRKFVSLEQLREHERHSKLHAFNVAKLQQPTLAL
jgi:RNA recognition motif-containing protein